MSSTEVNEFVTAWWPVAVGVYTCAGGVVTFYARTVHTRILTLYRTVRENEKACDERVEKIERELAAHRLHVAETYATSSEVQTLFGQVIELLRRIEDKLERKADK
jgi:hypothetical protein